MITYSKWHSGMSDTLKRACQLSVFLQARELIKETTSHYRVSGEFAALIGTTRALIIDSTPV